MAVSDDYLSFLKDQLVGLGEIQAKRMFGGVGFFKDGLMFGMVGNDTFRLKVDASNEQDFSSRGMKPYQSSAKKKGMPYWEVPPEVLEDATELAKWALRSIEIAKKAASKK